jgi:alkanesulfonate monooxygenase SsuD/methylene tetrahydromethanopterin reductase-like flavin-dependent oxidoreductase (luciferase family)
MRVGLHIGKFDWSGSPGNIGEKLVEIARTVDNDGYYSLWLPDHLQNAMYVEPIPRDSQQQTGEKHV